jgi:large subunit ribosomal protein L4
MKAPVFTLTGPSKTEVELSESIFSTEVNPSLMAQAVRVYLANQRQGNANTKGRGEVTGSTRKIYKQKGTGNARHGDIKAPVFVGGGIVFGPVTHPFTMSFPVKMRRAALRSALSSQSEKVAVMDGFAGVAAKTKVVLSAVEKAVGESKKPLVVITGEMETVKKALGNAQGYDFMNVTDLNTYEVLNHDVLVIAQEALPILEEWLGKGK